MGHQTYEVRVVGIVPDEDLRDMGAVALATEPATTTLYGEIADDAALYALLARLHALGLEVVEVRRVSAVQPAGDDEDDQVVGSG